MEKENLTIEESAQRFDVRTAIVSRWKSTFKRIEQHKKSIWKY
jgi:hypothetical protein